MRRFAVKQYCLRKIRKIRHRKGYGVHSPFAYNLITKVIEEKSGYYAYQSIDGLHRTLHDKVKSNRRKYRLLFRLVNRFKPQIIVELGSGGGDSTLYLQQGSPQAHVYCFEPDDIRRASAEQLCMHLPGNVTFVNCPLADGIEFLSSNDIRPDFIYLHRQSDTRQYEILLRRLGALLADNGLVVIDGIRQKKSVLREWHYFTEQEKVRTTFDLYNTGIAICNPKLDKRNYIVAF